MADLAQLGIVVNYDDKQASQKLTALNTAADKLTKTTETLEKVVKRASDVLGNLGKGASTNLANHKRATDEITKSWAHLKGELNKIDRAFNEIGGSQTGLKELQKNLSEVTKDLKKSHEVGKVTGKQYQEIGEFSDRLSLKLKEQANALKDLNTGYYNSQQVAAKDAETKRKQAEMLSLHSKALKENKEITERWAKAAQANVELVDKEASARKEASLKILEGIKLREKENDIRGKDNRRANIVEISRETKARKEYLAVMKAEIIAGEKQRATEQANIAALNKFKEKQIMLQKELAADYAFHDREAQKYNRQLKIQKENLNRLEEAFNKVITRVKQFAAFIAAAAIVQAFTQSIRESLRIIIDFDQALKSLQAIAGATATEAAVMGDVIRKIAADTKFSAQEVAEGMQTIGKAGFTVGEALKMIQGVSNLATGALEDFNTVAGLVVTAIRAFGLEVVETNRITDIFANAITGSKLSVDSLITAFGYVGAAGAQAGLSLNEVSGTLMVLADNGIRASTMGTALRKTLLSMLAPNESLKNALYSVGMSLDDINPGMVGYEQALRNITPLVWDFENATVDMAKAKEFFGIRASQVAAILIRETAQGGGISRAIESTKELGSALRMAEKQQEGLGVKFKNLADSAKNVALTIGDAGLNNALHNLVDGLKIAVTSIENFIKTFPIVQIAGWTAATLSLVGAIYAIGKAVLFILPALRAFAGTMILTPWGAAITGAIALGAAIVALKPNAKNTTEAFERQAVVMRENISTIEGWIRVLEEAREKGESFYYDALTRYAFENKELSKSLVDIINQHKLLGDETVSSLEQVTALSSGFKELSEVVKEAIDILLFTEAQKELSNLKQSLVATFQDLKKAAEDAAIKDIIIPATSNRQDAIAAANEYARAIKAARDSAVVDLRDIQSEINNVAQKLFNLAQKSPDFNTAIIEQLQELEKELKDTPGVFNAVFEQLNAIMANAWDRSENDINQFKKILGELPASIKEMEKNIPVLKIMDYEKQKADLEKQFNEMRDTILKSDLFKAMGISVSELEEQLRTAFFAALVKAREGLDDTGDSVKKVADKLTEAEKAAKRAAESLKDLQVQSALESYFEDLDNYDDHLREKEEMAAKAEESIKTLRIQKALDSYFEDIDNYEQYLKDKKAAEEKAREDKIKAEEKAAAEIEKEWERVYDDMHKFAADTFYDIFDGQLDSFEDFADSMLDIFKRMLANMAAEAAMTNIFKPLMNQMAGSALGNMLGLPSIPSPTSLLSMGNTAWNAYTGATSRLAYSGLTALGVPGAVGGTAAQSAILAGGGSMAEAASIAGGSIGSSGLAGTIAAAAPWAAMAAVAIPIVMGLLEDEPDPLIGIFAGTGTEGDLRTSQEGFFYHTNVQDISGSAGDAIVSYYDSVFAALDDITERSINDIINEADYGDYARISWFDPSGMDTQQIIDKMMDDLFGALREGLVSDIGMNMDTGIFDESFFKGMQVEGETLLDTYARFREVVEGTDDFVGEFSRRIDDLGLSAETAYQQIETINNVLSEMDAAISTITSGTATTQLNTMVDTWNAYIDVMAQAQATTEQLTEAESKRNLVVGSQITGLNVNSIAQALGSGQDISTLVGQAINQLVNEQIASEMFDEMSPIVEEAGRIWSDTGGDINAVSAYLKDAGYAFNDLTDSMDAFVQEAELIVAEALQGTLTASQLFLQWGIENQAAQELFADMTKARVTEKKLKGAVDAFVDLGLKGDKLTSVIGYLADAFVDAARDLEDALNGIDDAIDDLPGGEDAADAADAFRRAFEAFLDFPTLSEIITGGDTEYEITFDEEAYNAALSDAAKDILGDMARDFNYNFGIEGQDQGWWGGESGAEYSVKQMYSAVGIPSSDDVIEYWTNNILSGAYETGLAFSEDFLAAVARDMSGYSSDVLDDLFSKIGAYDLVSEDDFTTREEIPSTPPISSEKDISEALDRLAQFKDADFDIFTDYMDFFDEIRAIQADLGSDVIYDIFGEDTEGIISDITAAYDAYQKALEDAGAEAKANTDAEERRLESIQSIVDHAQGYLDQIGMTDLEKTIDDIQKQEADWITQLEGLNASTEDMAVITEWAAEKIREAQEAWDLELLNERLDLAAQLYDLMEDEAEAAKNLARFRMLELQEMDESLRPMQRRIWLLEDLSDAESSYLEYLQAEIDARQEVYDEAKSVLEDYISDEEALIEARRNASDSINDFIAELMGSSASPVQSMDFFEGRYAELLEEARTAGPEDIEAAVSNLTAFTSDYLDFAGAYGGDYNTLYNSIIKDLEDLGIDQLDKADDQEDALIDIKDLIGATDEKLFDINEAIQSYVDAKESLDEASWMRDELDKLQDIDDNLTLLLLAQEKYYALLNRDNVPIDDPDPTTPDPDPVVPDPTIPPEDIDWRAFQEKYENQISQLWDQYIDFNWDDYTINLPELDIFNMTDMEFLEDLYKNINDYIDRLGLDTTGLDGYASGGIATGPDSGYLAMLHGNEAIIPLNNGYVPVQIQSNSSDDMKDVKRLLESILANGSGNNTFLIQIGSREIEDFTVKVLETNPEAHKQIRRVSHA